MTYNLKWGGVGWGGVVYFDNCFSDPSHKVRLNRATNGGGKTKKQTKSKKKQKHTTTKNKTKNPTTTKNQKDECRVSWVDADDPIEVKPPTIQMLQAHWKSVTHPATAHRVSNTRRLSSGPHRYSVMNIKKVW